MGYLIQRCRKTYEHAYGDPNGAARGKTTRLVPGIIVVYMERAGTD